jgi:flagellin-like protein
MTDKFISLKGSDRGITGIGVLILFIALVLVAAIASGVILDTAGFLQNTAADTGTDATDQVSNQVQVLAATGDVDSNREVTDIRANVFKSPGASDIDLSDSTIQYVAPNGSAVLVYNAATPSAGAEEYEVSDYLDADGSVPVLNDKDDRFEVHILLDGSAGTAMDTLKEGDSATLRLTSQSGATTTYIVDVPESLASSEDSEVLL